jgi:hypothetical protein
MPVTRRLPLICLLIAVAAATSVVPAAGLDAADVMTRLKQLAGTWSGPPEGEGEAEGSDLGEVVHEFRVSANGTVVMETMRPGTDHEMINMYHLDGDDLLLTHYCAGGNQPRMRLVRERSTAQRLVFDFVDGTNLDPGVDAHIHAAEILFEQDGRVISRWMGWQGGEEAGRMSFALSRAE